MWCWLMSFKFICLAVTQILFKENNFENESQHFESRVTYSKIKEIILTNSLSFSIVIILIFLVAVFTPRCD